MKVAILCVSLLALLVINPSYGVVNPIFDSNFGTLGSGNGQMNAPEDVARDSSGSIYVVDTNNNRIQKFNSAGTYVSQFGGAGATNGKFNAPSGIALDSAGNIYVVDTNNNRIQKFNSAGTYVSKFGSAGTTNGRFNGPDDLVLDSSGNIYVVDTNNNRIQKFNSAGTYVSQFGGAGATNGKFNAPSGIALDSAGNIYVVDTNNNRIQKFNSAGTYVSKFGSAGSNNGQFSVPQGVFVDSYNNILVSDTGNHRIQKFTSSGSFVLSFGSFGTGNNQFRYQQQVIMNGLNGFVADSNNNRVWLFHFPEEPIADDQSVATTEENPISIILTASDANNDPLTYSVASQPTHGVITGTPPSLTYTPSVNYFGIDSFTFKANDGDSDSNIATVQINVGNINDPPTSNSQSVTTNEDTQLAITTTASDPDGNQLQFTMINTVQYGTISGTLPNVMYTPNLNYFGTDSFSFKVNDGLVDSNTATISITINSVNDAPIAYDVNATLNEDTSIHTSSIPYQQTDVENDPVSFVIVTPLSHGVLSGDPDDLIYTPDQDYYGDDCFTFKFNDGEFDSNVATGCAIILPVNDIPVANSQSVQTDEETPISITLSGSDIENNTLTYSIISQPSNGILSGTVPNLTYTPEINYHGTDNFSFRVYDGIAYSTVKTVSITINPINDAPVAYSMNFTTLEDTPFVNTATVAYDIESSSLTYILISPPTHGTLSGEAPTMTYTPDVDYVGSDSLQFMVNDGELDSDIATIYMDIGPANDSPITLAQSVTTDEDVPFDLVLQATDVDNDVLTYHIVQSPEYGSLDGTPPNITYTPYQNKYGLDSFSFYASDGISNSDLSTISITITSINDAPVILDANVIVQEDTPYHSLNEYLRISSDAEDDPLTFVLLSAPTHGTLSGTLGNMTYTPASNYFGSDCITFRANDGNLYSNVATACAIIQSVNDAPVADDQEITMTSNTLQHIELTASDIENDTLTYSIISQPSYGILFGIDSHLQYLPNRNYVGTDEFTFKADDGNATSLPATISFIITQPTETEIETAVTTSDSGRFTINAIPRISSLSINTEKLDNPIIYDFTTSSPTNTIKATTNEKVQLQIILDDEEASKQITHVGIYTNIREGNSDIKNSKAYVVFDMGLPVKITDVDGIFKDAQINTSYQDRSMIVDAILTFGKPMKESDVILEVWNQGRHPVYQTIPSILTITEPEDLSGPNISGTVMIPESESKDPIRVFSVASGKVTEIRNDAILSLPNKDMTIRISGFIDGVQRGEKVHLAILRPDDTTYMTDAFLSEDGRYMMLTKLHTKWESGLYEIQVNCMNEDRGSIRFVITDKELVGGQFGGVMDQPKILPTICKYHHGNITKEDLVAYLKEAGLSQNRINAILLEHRPAYVNPYAIYYLAGLVPLLYVLVTILSKKNPQQKQFDQQNF